MESQAPEWDSRRVALSRLLARRLRPWYMDKNRPYMTAEELTYARVFHRLSPGRSLWYFLEYGEVVRDG